ncbi:hypothetical protein [Phytoactinopolyspora mesophila]|uniref:Uncharacterized protein n=1 Tax=Phytoactinopolyspora mesophila TaxID=2650750 RepID=A0A7K3M8G8_9ACTN|nr:hypothetical protein [Phytoactinopolyspora mesophila]NDL59574.1 hypothetical protein [Phytoactinopolyspora mesophila]
MSEMLRIGHSTAVGALPLTLTTGGLTSLLLAFPASNLFDGSPAPYLFALGCLLAVVPGGIFLFLTLTYRPVAFDPRTGTARLGRKTVPLATVTKAWRQISNAGHNTSYVSYRFESTDGAWGRVLIAGSPLRGLDAEGLARLERFIDAIPLEEPHDDGLSPAQRQIADSAAQYGSKTPVGRAAMLAELRGSPPSAPTAARLSVSQLRRLERQWDHDDAAAEQFFASRPASPRGTRRIAGRLAAAAVSLAALVIAVAAVGEQVAGGDLPDNVNRAAGIGVGAAFALGLASGLVYCIAADAAGRRRQQEALSWLETRDSFQRTRGLPPRLLAAFTGTPPGERTVSFAVAVCAVLGTGCLIAGPVVWSTEPDWPFAVGLALLCAGIVFSSLAAALIVRANRSRRHQQLLGARLGGQRLLAHHGELDSAG